MKVKSLVTFVGIVLASGLYSSQVLAANAGNFYIGADVGTTQFSGDGPSNDSIFVGGQKFNDSDSSYGLHAGFQFNEWFALELAYTDFGDATDSFNIQPFIKFVVAPNNTQTVSTKGTSLLGVFSYSLSSNVSLLGTLGLSSTQYDYRMSGGFAEATGSLLGSHNLSNQGLVLGTGIKYALTDSLAVRADLRRNDVGDFNLDTMSLGLEYSF